MSLLSTLKAGQRSLVHRSGKRLLQATLDFQGRHSAGRHDAFSGERGFSLGA